MRLDPTLPSSIPPNILYQRSLPILKLRYFENPEHWEDQTLLEIREYMKCHLQEATILTICQETCFHEYIEVESEFDSPLMELEGRHRSGKLSQLNIHDFRGKGLKINGRINMSLLKFPQPSNLKKLHLYGTMKEIPDNLPCGLLHITLTMHRFDSPRVQLSRLPKTLIQLDLRVASISALQTE